MSIDDVPRAATPPSPAARPTTRDVARRAGVSQATVSNVLNHPERVTPERREAVLGAIAELGFVRHEGARQLRSGHSRTIGLLLLDAWNPAFQDMARGVEETTDASGWSLLMANSARALEREETYVRLFSEARVAGMIVIPHDEHADTLHRVRAGGARVVVVDRAEHSDDALSVAVDDAEGGRLAAEHLCDLGHRRLLFIGDAGAATPVHERLGGIEQVVARTPGAEVEVWSVPLTIEGGREAGERFAAMEPAERPTAILAAIDAVAFGALQSLLAHDVRIPEDVSVIGYDDIALTRHLSVSLTTVHRPHVEMGVAAARLLLQTLEGSMPDDRHIMFEPELVVRASTAAPRSA